jgi:hypothetical protein
MTKYDKTSETYSAPKGAKGISGIKSSIQHGQHKAASESGYPGMADSTPQEKDKNQSAR